MDRKELWAAYENSIEFRRMKAADEAEAAAEAARVASLTPKEHRAELWAQLEAKKSMHEFLSGLAMEAKAEVDGIYIELGFPPEMFGRSKHV